MIISSFNRLQIYMYILKGRQYGISSYLGESDYMFYWTILEWFFEYEVDVPMDMINILLD